jgi:hypothetical protein
MTNHSSHAALDRLKQLASAPNSVGNIWREHGTPKRYRKGGKDGQDGIEIPTCPTKGPKGTSGGAALRMLTDPVFA